MAEGVAKRYQAPPLLLTDFAFLTRTCCQRAGQCSIEKSRCKGIQ